MAEKDIIVLVEEPSAYEIVRAISAKLEIGERVLALKHQGAGDLERSLTNKIAKDPFPNTKFLVLRDADGKDCIALKKKLLAMAPNSRRQRTKVRIVCQELEAWYLAQPTALRSAGLLKKALPRSILATDPDTIADPKRRLLQHIHDRGQIDISRKIAPFLDPASNKSRSFSHFVSALRALAAIT